MTSYRFQKKIKNCGHLELEIHPRLWF